MTPAFCCGFECGAGHWTLTGATYSTSSPLTGLRSLLANPTAAIHKATTVKTFGAGIIVGRFRVNFTTLPNVDTLIFGISSSFGAWFKTSDGKIYCGDAFGPSGVGGVSVSTGVDYYIDVKTDVSTTTWTVNVKVNGVACTQDSGGQTADTTARTIIIGFNSSSTSSARFDDVILSTTSGDYPIGNGKVLAFSPNADGTHTATGTNITKGTIGTPVGAGITSATTDAFGYVNAKPLGGGATDNTRLINQQTNATEYVEVDFEPTTETNAPRAVEIITGDRQAATTTGSFITKLNDNGTENDIINRSVVAGSTSDRWATKQYATMPADSAAWTLTRFNALKARFGYSGDATPDQYWRGIMIEAEFPPSTGLLYSNLESMGRGMFRGMGAT